MGHKLAAKLENAYELFENYPGEPERRIVHIVCTLTGEGLDVSTLIRVALPDDAPTDAAESVAVSVQRQLPKQFATKPDIFQEQDIALTGKLPKAGDYKAPIEFSVSDKTFKELQLQAEHYAAARKGFDEAVAKLRRYAKQGIGSIHGNQSEINSLLGHIDMCLDMASLGHMYNWYREKRGCVQTHFSDLFRRKDGAHSGFKAGQEYIGDALYGFHAPRQWLQRPPVRS